MQRFKAALPCGAFNPENPEKLIRDKSGEFVFYKDHLKEVKELKERIEDLEDPVPSLGELLGMDED